MHFDVSDWDRRLAAAAGAIDVDRSCSLEEFRQLADHQANLEQIAHV
jgi:hypothetical protein